MKMLANCVVFALAVVVGGCYLLLCVALVPLLFVLAACGAECDFLAYHSEGCK